MYQSKPISIRPNQSGVALVVSLIMLTIITLLSISAMRSTTLDTKIAVNHQFKELSFQAAENALAIVIGPELSVIDDLDIPNVEDETTVSDPFFTTHSPQDGPIDTSLSEQPVLSTRLEMTYKGKREGLFFSGYQLDNITHIFQADAFGSVGGSTTSTHNRMQVGLIR